MCMDGSGLSSRKDGPNGNVACDRGLLGDKSEVEDCLISEIRRRSRGQEETYRRRLVLASPTRVLDPSITMRCQLIARGLAGDAGLPYIPSSGALKAERGSANGPITLDLRGCGEFSMRKAL